VTPSDQTSVANVRRILDTQIISYAMKNRWPDGAEPQDVSRAVISSVTALELLEVQRSGASKKPRYYLYPPLVPELNGDDEVVRKWDRGHKRGVGAGRKEPNRSGDPRLW
jgi:hypothetical protein